MDNIDFDAATLFIAKAELASLDVATSALKTVGPQDLLTVAVSKAVTVASLHANIETRVLCDNVRDLCDASGILGGKHCAELKGVWDAKTRTLSFGNGSAVVVVFQPKAKMQSSGKAGR